MADNKNMEINDEEMKNAAGGNWNEIGLPLPRFKEGDPVRVKGYEQYDAVIAEVEKYATGSSKTWYYEVHIFTPVATLIHSKSEQSLSPA